MVHTFLSFSKNRCLPQIKIRYVDSRNFIGFTVNNVPSLRNGCVHVLSACVCVRTSVCVCPMCVAVCICICPCVLYVVGPKLQLNQHHLLTDPPFPPVPRPAPPFPPTSQVSSPGVSTSRCSLRSVHCPSICTSVSC